MVMEIEFDLAVFWINARKANKREVKRYEHET